MTDGKQVRNEVGSSDAYLFTDPSSGFDIRANDPKGLRRPCREILVLSAGTIELTREDGVDTGSSANIAAGVTLPVQATAIVSGGTSSTEVLILW